MPASSRIEKELADFQRDYSQSLIKNLSPPAAGVGATPSMDVSNNYAEMWKTYTQVLAEEKVKDLSEIVKIFQQAYQAGK